MVCSTPFLMMTSSLTILAPLTKYPPFLKATVTVSPASETYVSPSRISGVYAVTLTRTCRWRTFASSVSDKLPVPTRAASVGARTVMPVWLSNPERRPVLLRAERKVLVLREVTSRVLERVAGTVKTLFRMHVREGKRA